MHNINHCKNTFYIDTNSTKSHWTVILNYNKFTYGLNRKKNNNKHLYLTHSNPQLLGEEQNVYENKFRTKNLPSDEKHFFCVCFDSKTNLYPPTLY